MKKIYILILFNICSFFIKAQHTITAASNPVAGDIESSTYLNKSGLFHGGSGTSQTWNYSGVTTNTLIGTPPSTYIAMSSVPNNFMFPGATIATDDGSGYYTVLSNNSTKFEYAGLAAASASNCILYSNPLKMYSIPFSYGTVSPDTYAYTMPGYTVSGTFTTTGDGTGTLQLPSGNFSNVLKMKFLVYQNVISTTGTDDYTISISRYYSSLSKFPLLEVQTNTASITSGTNIVVNYDTSGTINALLPTSISGEDITNSFVVFPNPVINGEFNLSIQMKGELTVDIYNTLGQIVKTVTFGEHNAIEVKKIDVTDLTSGIYYLHLNNKKATKTRKIIIE